MTAYSPYQLHTLFRELGSSYMLLVYMRNYPQPTAQGWLSRVSGHSLKTIREKLKILYDRGLIEPAARYQWSLTPTAHEVLDSRWCPEAATPIPTPAPARELSDLNSVSQKDDLKSAREMDDLDEYPARKTGDLYSAHKICDLNSAGKKDELHSARKISDLNSVSQKDDLHSAPAIDQKVHLAPNPGDRMVHLASELGDQKELLFPAVDRNVHLNAPDDHLNHPNPLCISNPSAHSGDRKEHLIPADDHTEHTYPQRIPNLSTPSADQNVHLFPADDRFDQLNSIDHLNLDQSFKKLNELKDLKDLKDLKILTTTTTTIHESIDRSSSSILNGLAQNFENDLSPAPTLISADVSSRSYLDDEELVALLSNYLNSQSGSADALFEDQPYPDLLDFLLRHTFAIANSEFEIDAWLEVQDQRASRRTNHGAYKLLYLAGVRGSKLLDLARRKYCTPSYVRAQMAQGVARADEDVRLLITRIHNHDKPSAIHLTTGHLKKCTCPLCEQLVYTTCERCHAWPCTCGLFDRYGQFINT
jgi:hypothetical protein